MQTIALGLFGLLALVALGFAARYLRARSFMPYHQVIVGRPWEQIEPRLQAVLVGMLRTIGGGLLVCGVALLWLLLPLSRGEPWAAWAAASVVLASGLPTALVLRSLQRLEPAARPPLAPTLASLVVAAVALVLFLA